MPRRKSISPALPSSATVAAVAAVCALAVTGGPLAAPPSRVAPPGAWTAGLTSASVVATFASPVVDFGFPTAGVEGPRPTAAPPRSAPQTAAPPRSVPQTAAPPRSVPPTAAPPRSAPPTAAPLARSRRRLPPLARPRTSSRRAQATPPLRSRSSSLIVRPNGGPLPLPATAHGLRPRLWPLPTPTANAPNPPPPPTRPPVAHVRARCPRPRGLPPSLGDTLAPALCPRRWPSLSTLVAAFSTMVAAPTTSVHRYSGRVVAAPAVSN
ncbi:hypothetical protein BU14_0144s0017, partial [Porphyra umbilicalis]